jgi:hypothetical protein
LAFVNAAVKDPQATLREELNHALQHSLVADKTLFDHLHDSAVDFVETSDAGFLAAEKLARLGYDFSFSPGKAAAEVGVRLMDAGRWREICYSIEQAEELSALYVQLLEKEYGHEATSEIRQLIAEALESNRKSANLDAERTNAEKGNPLRQQQSERRPGTGLGPDDDVFDDSLDYSLADHQNSLFGDAENQDVARSAALDKDNGKHQAGEVIARHREIAEP